VRLFLVGSSNVWLPRSFDERVLAEQAGRFLRTFKNVYSGIFAQYANFGWSPSEQDPPVAARPIIDRWMISRLARLERTVDDALEAFDATTAARALIEFVDDDLANWYVRLNRARFYEVDGADNRAAFATLYEVLVSVCRLLAPFAPFVSDWVHRELTGESVHLAPFVAPRREPVDATLDDAMRAIRTIARLGRAAREEAGIKVRQPLSRMVCVAPNLPEAVLEQLLPLAAAELNLKQVELATSGDSLVTLEPKPNFRSLGKKFGKNTPLAAQAVAAFDSDELRLFLRGEPLVVTVEGVSHELTPEDVTIIRRASGSLVVEEDGGFFAAIDPTITPALKLEGYARELISRVQRMRKEAGFAVSDRIVLAIEGGPEVKDVIDAHGAWIAEEVLATELAFVEPGQTQAQDRQSIDLDGITAQVAITRIQ
jgi:isoleucyl-tRNA synthetase